MCFYKCGCVCVCVLANSLTLDQHSLTRLHWIFPEPEIVVPLAKWAWVVMTTFHAMYSYLEAQPGVWGGKQPPVIRSPCCVTAFNSNGSRVTALSRTPIIIICTTHPWREGKGQWQTAHLRGTFWLNTWCNFSTLGILLKVWTETLSLTLHFLHFVAVIARSAVGFLLFPNTYNNSYFTFINYFYK